MSQVYDPSSDVLTIAGVVIPPSSQLGQERFRAEFPASAVAEPTTDGDTAVMVTRSKGAVLTVQVLAQDVAHTALLSLLQQQQQAGVAKVPWAVSLVRRGSTGGGTEKVIAEDAVILQQPPVVSSGSITVGTWTLSLIRATRTVS